MTRVTAVMLRTALTVIIMPILVRAAVMRRAMTLPAMVGRPMMARIIVMLRGTVMRVMLRRPRVMMMRGRRVVTVARRWRPMVGRIFIVLIMGRRNAPSRQKKKRRQKHYTERAHHDASSACGKGFRPSKRNKKGDRQGLLPVKKKAKRAGTGTPNWRDGSCCCACGVCSKTRSFFRLKVRSACCTRYFLQR